MTYTFRQIPDVTTVEELRQWLGEELKLISESLNDSTEVELRGSRHEPERPREGMIIHADGTAWNPGGGQGTYRYQSGVWVKIGSGDGNVTGQASSVDGEIALFSGTGGKTIKRATGTGIVKVTSGVFSTGTVSNAELDDMAAWTIKMRNNAASGDPQDQTVNDLTEETVGDASADFVLMWDASGSVMRKMKPNNFGLSSGGLTLITSASFPAANTWSFTGLAGYKMLWVSLRNVTQASGAARTLQCALSGNNGSSYGTARIPSNLSIASGTGWYGSFMITRCDQTNNQLIMTGNLLGGPVGPPVDTGSLGPINAIQLSFSVATNFSAGDVEVYGIR